MTEANVWLPFYTALLDRAKFELVAETATSTQLRVIGRIQPDGMASWLKVMRSLLLANGEGWALDISKQYFMRADGVRYAWRIILQGENIAKHAPAIAALVYTLPPSTEVGQHMVMEVPLLGVGPDRNSLKRGKGAQAHLKAKTGADIKRSLFTE